MTRLRGQPIGRRLFVVRAGLSVLGVAVLDLAACTAGEGRQRADQPGVSGSAAGLTWRRVDLAYVSAFVLVREGEAAVVDTGVGGSANRIGDALAAAGTQWNRVRHVVVTHGHFDHVGSLAEVANRAAGATLHAGTRELELLHTLEPAASDLTPLLDPKNARRWRRVDDGSEVLGLQVVATPGHTEGHICVFDPASGVLVAGDALTNTVDGVLGGSLPQVTWDVVQAEASVRKLALLEPRVILVGHGPPVVWNAADQLRHLAASPS